MYEGLWIRVYAHVCAVYCVYVSQCGVCIVYTIISMYIGLSVRVEGGGHLPRVWCVGRGMGYEHIRYQGLTSCLSMSNVDAPV
jgi:hypothetical protein